MRLVLATDSLAGFGGSETYLVTVADQLQRLGHDVWLHADRVGRAADHATALGLRATADTAALPPQVDAILVQDGAVAADLALRYPLVPQAFVAHSDIFDLQLPLGIPALTAVVITLYDRVHDRIRALSHPFEIVRLSQPVDVTRFTPTQPLRERPRVALALGNYVRGRRQDTLQEACALAGIELRSGGLHTGAGMVDAPEVLYNQADIVFGKARVIVEAMACGRAAYVFDHNGAEGWVTRERYPVLAPDNFGGQSDPIVPDAARIAADLARYSPALGVAGRDLAVAHHAASKHAVALVEILAGLVPRPAPVDAPLFELARLVRTAHRADARQFALQAQTEQLGARVHALEDELAAERTARQADARHQAGLLELTARERDAAGAEAGAARAEAERARADGERVRADADRARRALAAVAGSARWRAVQRALGPADRLRAARRELPSTGPPRAVAPAAGRAPAPFVVGVPRSGTTLLRLLLDAHPQLAIGPETGLGFLIADLVARDAGPRETAAAISGLATFPDLGLDAGRLQQLLLAVRPWSLADGVRAVYADYAARQRKPRWGDKTPTHLRVAGRLAGLLPEAHVIHLIRDGRGVLLSVRDLHFAPGDGSVEAIAADWRDGIQALRAAAASGAVPHYREVRYEELLARPEAVLRELCDWLQLGYDPQMLRAHERARSRFAELPAVRWDGAVTRTREQRWAIHAKTARPPDPAEGARWRTALSEADIARFEAVAGALLTDLGHPLSAPLPAP